MSSIRTLLTKASQKLGCTFGPALGLALGLSFGVTLPALPVFAQNLFAPVARVDGAAITAFEVQQRARFLSLLNVPGGTEEAALEALIVERLRLQGARSFGLTLPEEGLQAGLEDFASRANLSVEEFAAALEQAGVQRETFRDFVAVQVLWRDLIRARFSNRVQVSEVDIERALAASGQASGLRVLLSEIIMAAPPPRRAQVQARAEEISQVQTEAEFSALARQFSATASRGAGGRLDWTPLNNLPPQLRPLILNLAPGEVTAPLALPNAIALFQLRAIEETGAPPKEFEAIEYAAYYIAGGRTQDALQRAERLRKSVDVCDDLFGVAQNQPPEVLDRGSLPPEEIPQDIAIELAKLDPGEVSTNLTRANGQTLVFLMLCGRTPKIGEETNRQQVADDLRQQRFQGFANSFEEELRSAATIEIFGN